jgi:YVTN family beta-propeller protein
MACTDQLLSDNKKLSPQKTITGKLYVNNSGSNTVSVIDFVSNEVVKTIEVGKKPVSLALSPDHSRLVVTNQGSNDLSVVDTASDSVVATIGLRYGNIAFTSAFLDTSLLAVAIRRLHYGFEYPVGLRGVKGPSLIILVDLNKPAPKDTLFVLPTHCKAIYDLTVSMEQHLLCICGQFLSQAFITKPTPFLVIDYQTKQTLSMPLTGALNAIFSPDGKYIYSGSVGKLYRWDIDKQITEEVYRNTTPREFKFGKIVLSNNGKTLYSTSNSYDKLMILDLESLEQKLFQVAGRVNSFTLLEWKKWLYMVHHQRNSVSIYDLSSHSTIKEISVGISPGEIIFCKSTH